MNTDSEERAAQDAEVDRVRRHVAFLRDQIRVLADQYGETVTPD